MTSRVPGIWVILVAAGLGSGCVARMHGAYPVGYYDGDYYYYPAYPRYYYHGHPEHYERYGAHFSHERRERFERHEEHEEDEHHRR